MPKELKFDQATGTADRELVITRLFDAPRELVFDVFTHPEHLMKWWGPHGCTVIACEADPRPGGTWRISMRSPKVLPQFANRFPIKGDSGPAPAQDQIRGDAGAYEPEWIVEKQRGEYQEVVKPERLVFSYEFVDETGRPRHQTLVTINLAAEGGRTKLTLHQAMFESVTARDDHVIGWGEALEHFAEYLGQLQ